MNSGKGEMSEGKKRGKRGTLPIKRTLPATADNSSGKDLKDNLIGFITS